MSYRLRIDHDLLGEVRRIATGQLEAAIAALSDPAADPDTAIHDARKRVKKVRGLVRIVRTRAPDLYRQENARLRDAARGLSGLRDAAALIETVDGLRQHITDEHAPDALAAVAANLAARRDRLTAQAGGRGPAVDAALAAFRESGEAFDALNRLDGSDARTVAEGWRHNCAAGRRALKACAEVVAHGGDPVPFHDLRKRMKYHWMHVRLLEALWPSAMKLRRHEAKRLEVILGDEHNLAVLADLAESEPDAVGTIGERDLLARLVADRRAELRAAALAGAKVLFSESPKASARRVRFLWQRLAD